MEITSSIDKYTVGPDGKPSRVTDYKLFFPGDFIGVGAPQLSFTQNRDYVLTGFKIQPGQLTNDISTLLRQKMVNDVVEHGIVHVNTQGSFFRTKAILQGESGIGWKIVPNLPTSDYLHTHIYHKGENPKAVDLFSAFDLLSLGSKGAERYWLIGTDVVWCLVNLYQQRYYHSIKEASWELAQKYKVKQSYENRLADLIDCVRKCDYRLYRSDNLNSFSLVS